MGIAQGGLEKYYIALPNHSSNNSSKSNNNNNRLIAVVQGLKVSC